MKRRTPTGSAQPGQRQLRVAERIRHLLAEILQRGELYDPVLSNASLISVTAVEIGPDLKHATAYITPIGGKNGDEIVHALNRAQGYFRSEIAPKMDLRYTPKVSFRLDNSFANAAHIEGILRQDRVRKDVTAPPREENKDPWDDEDDEN